MKDVKALVLNLVAAYRDDGKMKKALEEQYGAGIADFFAAAAYEFYKE